MKVFNPLAKQTLKAVYASAESIRRKKYNHRIMDVWVIPIVNRPSVLLAEKKSENLSEVKHWIRTRLALVF